MIDTFKRTFVIGMLVFLCFLSSMLMIKQFVMEEELATCRDKITFLQEDVIDLVRQCRGIYIPHHEECDDE